MNFMKNLVFCENDHKYSEYYFKQPFLGTDL